jgi:hypothetical protein
MNNSEFKQMVTMKYHWFGDSWVRGDELQNRQACFAQLVSNHFGAECCNYGRSGGSNDSIPWYFAQHLNAIDPKSDCVFFGMGASSWTSVFDRSGRHRMCLHNAHTDRHPVYHPDQGIWFEKFDSPKQRVYNREKSIQLLWLWCQQQGIKCYFYNTVAVPQGHEFETSADSAWIVPKNSCIALLLVPFLDQDSEFIVTEDQPWMTQLQWKQLAPTVEQWIRPGYKHPNIAGHKLIADYFIEFLNE